MTDYVTAFMNEKHLYHSEAVRLAARLVHETTIIDGVLRWKSNNRVPPNDCVLLADYIGLPLDMTKCEAMRAAEIADLLGKYRAARKDGPTEEEKIEARAAMGPGVTMVDVVTGHKWKT